MSTNILQCSSSSLQIFVDRANFGLSDGFGYSPPFRYKSNLCSQKTHNCLRNCGSCACFLLPISFVGGVWVIACIQGVRRSSKEFERIWSLRLRSLVVRSYGGHAESTGVDWAESAHCFQVCRSLVLGSWLWWRAVIVEPSMRRFFLKLRVCCRRGLWWSVSFCVCRWGVVLVRGWLFFGIAALSWSRNFSVICVAVESGVYVVRVDCGKGPWFSMSKNARFDLLWFFIRSKTYCPYCRSVKEFLKGLGAEAKVIEIDKESKTARALTMVFEYNSLWIYSTVACDSRMQF